MEVKQAPVTSIQLRLVTYMHDAIPSKGGRYEDPNISRSRQTQNGGLSPQNDTSTVPAELDCQSQPYRWKGLRYLSEAVKSRESVDEATALEFRKVKVFLSDVVSIHHVILIINKLNINI